MNEKLIEKKLREIVKAKNGVAIKFQNPSFTGLPDRIVLMPRGRVFFVEFKTTGKKPTARQLNVFEMLKTLGHQVSVIDSQEKLNKFKQEL